MNISMNCITFTSKTSQISTTYSIYFVTKFNDFLKFKFKFIKTTKG